MKRNGELQSMPEPILDVKCPISRFADYYKKLAEVNTSSANNDNNGTQNPGSKRYVLVLW